MDSTVKEGVVMRKFAWLAAGALILMPLLGCEKRMEISGTIQQTPQEKAAQEKKVPPGAEKAAPAAEKAAPGAQKAAPGAEKAVPAAPKAAPPAAGEK
jgi:uncharacterized membrane protein